MSCSFGGTCVTCHASALAVPCLRPEGAKAASLPPGGHLDDASHLCMGPRPIWNPGGVQKQIQAPWYDGGGSRQDRPRPHLPRGGVGSRVVGSIRGRRQAASCARLCSRYGGGGKGSLDRRAVTGELPEPHAPSALLELSSLDPGLGARAHVERRTASIARGSRRTRSEKRSGWDYASVGHLVCLVQTCVKGPYLYLSLYL